MLKRTLLQSLMAGTILAATGLTAFAQEAFDGPTSGPKGAEAKTIVLMGSRVGARAQTDSGPRAFCVSKR